KAFIDVVSVLAGPVNRRPNIEAREPGVSRTIVEQAEIGSIARERIGQGESRRHKLISDREGLRVRAELQDKPGQPSPVGGSGKPAKITMPKDRRVHNIDRLGIETFQDRASEVLDGIDDERDWAK